MRELVSRNRTVYLHIGNRQEKSGMHQKKVTGDWDDEIKRILTNKTEHC
jgi:hypothetical protein